MQRSSTAGKRTGGRADSRTIGQSDGRTRGRAGGARGSAVLDEAPVLQLLERLAELLLGVHHDGAVPGHRFLDGTAGHEEEADPRVARAHRHVVAGAEEHQRAVPGLLAGQRGDGPVLLRQHAERFRRVAEGAAALEDVREGVAARVDGQPRDAPRGHGDVQVARLRRHALHRPRLPPEAPADHAHRRAVVVGHGGDRRRGDVLVARRGHLERGRQIGPQLEAVHPALRIALRHLLVQDAAAGRHPLHVAGAERAAVAEAVAVGHRAGEHVGDGLDAAVRVPREPGEVVRGPVVAEVVEEQEGVEVRRVPEAEGALQPHAGALHGGLRRHDALHGPDGHRTSSPTERQGNTSSLKYLRHAGAASRAGAPQGRSPDDAPQPGAAPRVHPAPPKANTDLWTRDSGHRLHA